MNKIAAAFVKAQKNFAPALKQSTNPHFRSQYVDLAGCVNAVIDALNENGIALVQHTHESDTGVIVETMFLHESGETMSCGKLHVPAAKQDPQGYGSALTYARRYSLMAACGIAPEDDDGNAAVKNIRKDPPAASGAGTKKEAYDGLSEPDQLWVDNLAYEVTELHREGTDPQVMIDHIREALGHTPNPEFKLALWWKLDSKVRTAIDQIQKGLKKAA